MVTYVLNMYGISVKYPLINSLFGSGNKSPNSKLSPFFRLGFFYSQIIYFLYNGNLCIKYL